MAKYVFNLSQALPFLPSSAGSPLSVGWGDLRESLLYGDQGDRSPWYYDASKSLAQVASHQPPMLSPPPPAHTTHTSTTPPPSYAPWSHTIPGHHPTSAPRQRSS